ncbi:FAD-binding and (Fe-S)-binding domain-containing protein [Glaciihabitans sp. UYNi722]|uniref:FAD-binding and (Fe-S)-binding domain-containing protein n=1 Tax=Glaciihabitans sp. UYNi722 TaxID=3156344 RepID=UPI00339851A3
MAELLRAGGVEAVDSGSRRRAEYSSDGSNYRVVPEVVVFPRHIDEVLATAEVARATSTPITSRGGGTSVVGNAIGPGIVIDFSRHLNRILDIDVERRTARVQPGVVLGQLQKATAGDNLRFGPDPSTWSRVTIGGMIGNNACGSHSLLFGKTADNVLELDFVDGLGRRITAGQNLDVVPGLQRFASENLGIIRTRLGRFGRQVSGYSLEHLLPEHGRNLARALVGTEGSLGIVLEAEIDLVEIPADPVLVVLGFTSMYAAADAVPAVLTYRPGAIEGLDSRLVDAVRASNGEGGAVEMPKGAGWLLVELHGSDRRAVEQQAALMAADADAISHRVVPAGAQTREIWRMREDGAGIAGRTAAGAQAWPGFEDAAVPPENLGAYLREFESLLVDHGIDGMTYGHFGDGCLHVRLDIPLERDGAALRAFTEDASRLTVRHNGSLSGEHGDGRARSELLSLMYPPEVIRAFGQFKDLFDPRDIMNPGVVVHPAPLDLDLRRPAALPLLSSDGFAFAHDDGDFTKAVHRCVGVGKCRADSSADGGFMCPSFIASSDEKDSTRGRARVLQEMANGSLIDRDFRSTEVRDALDLCLSCKACASDCPAGVDMAAYKSEVLFQSYRGRLRPVTHYLLGWLPRWARLASPFAPVVNAMLSIRPIQKAVLSAGGMDTHRSIPPFARKSFSRYRRRVPAVSPSRRKVMLWVDSFSDNFSPSIATSAIAVLESAGFDVVIPDRAVCCGLTWITTGQLSGARRALENLINEFAPFTEAGIPIVGLEPSCTAVLRSDVKELLPDDARVKAVSANVYTLAEFLASPTIGPIDWAPPRLDGVEIVVQPHCHQHAVMGFTVDQKLLTGLGAELTELAGCCGLAGNFGMEKGHYETSVAVAEHSLLPALRSAGPDSIFLADGFSCRTQADQLAGASGLHLAELLASRLPA